MKNSYVTVLALIIAAVFAFLWWKERAANSAGFASGRYQSLPAAEKDSIEKMVVDDYLKREAAAYAAATEPIDTAVANPMYRAFQGSAYFAYLDNRQGIRFDIKKLLFYLKYWQDELKATEADMRYALYPANWPYPLLRNKFTLLIYPSNGTTDIDPRRRTGSLEMETETLPLNLGNLYP